MSGRLRVRLAEPVRKIQPPLVFYSSWPLGFHNKEAERKAAAFASAGFDVTYVAGVGIRNPRLSRLPKASRVALDKLRVSRDVGSVARDLGLRTASVLVVPPRQARPVRRLNAAWMARQLSSALDSWSDAVAWIRSPTPELVDALAAMPPRLTVYECVDAFRHVPGLGRWITVVDEAERALAALADAVVVPSDPLAERFRSWGADVRLLPHGVDLFPWRERSGAAPEDVTIGFVGTLDYRLDVPVLRRVAEFHPEWRLRLIGPVQDGFDPRAVADLPNVAVEPPVPHERLPETLAQFTAGIMPYFDHPIYTHMYPVKNLELLAAGRAAVARPSPALERFSDVVYLARTPDEFVHALERAIAEDSPERARARRRVAEANTWERRLAEMVGIVEDLLAG